MLIILLFSEFFAIDSIYTLFFTEEGSTNRRKNYKFEESEIKNVDPKIYRFNDLAEKIDKFLTTIKIDMDGLY